MIIKRKSGFITKKIDEEFIVFDTDKGRVYELNPTAELIWKLLAKPRTIEEVVHNIAGVFGISQTKANKDVQVFIKKYTGSLFIIKD